jgi:hypothetical protein
MTMIDDIQKLMDDHTRWLQDKTALRDVGDGWIQVTTPRLDHHNDNLQFYVRKEGNGYLLTDDGYTINDLINSGCTLDDPKRQALLKTISDRFGVRLDNERLLLETTPENFAPKKQDFIQAMLSINNIFRAEHHGYFN